MTLHEFNNDIHAWIDQSEKFIVKSLGFLLGLAFVSAMKVKLSDHKMTIFQSVINFCISYFLGIFAYSLTNNASVGILSSLIGDQIIKWLLIKFSSKNINKTMNKVADKISDKAL